MTDDRVDAELGEMVRDVNLFGHRIELVLEAPMELRDEEVDAHLVRRFDLTFQCAEVRCTDAIVQCHDVHDVGTVFWDAMTVQPERVCDDADPHASHVDDHRLERVCTTPSDTRERDAGVIERADGAFDTVFAEVEAVIARRRDDPKFFPASASHDGEAGGVE